MKKSFKISVIAGFLALVVALPLAPASADMFLMPLRVYFKDGDRLKALTTMNSGRHQAIYRLSFGHKRQLPTGAYEELQGPLNPEYDPSQWLVYSPRQVDLPPQGKQGVRLSLRRPANLPDGEYRVHAVMQRIARNQIEGTPSKATAAFRMNVGFAVPIIIRVGKYDSQIEFQSFKLLPIDPQDKDLIQRAEVRLSRAGKHGAVGAIDAYWTPPGGGDEIQVAEQRGIAIYSELSERIAKVTFDKPIQGGKVRLVFRGIEGDRGIVYDEKSFPVQ